MIGDRSALADARGWIAHLLLVSLALFSTSAALCQSINVLWYTYSHPSSIYRQRIQTLAEFADGHLESSGLNGS